MHERKELLGFASGRVVLAGGGEGRVAGGKTGGGEGGRTGKTGGGEGGRTGKTGGGEGGRTGNTAGGEGGRTGNTAGGEGGKFGIAGIGEGMPSVPGSNCFIKTGLAGIAPVLLPKNLRSIKFCCLKRKLRRP